MSKLVDSKIVKKIESLSLNPNLSSDKGNSGQRKSKGHGNSMEFSDFREYFPGDDIRKIDWNIYGRFEKLFIKLFQEEREVLFNIIIDNSLSMDFGSPSKLELSKQLGALLSYIILNNDDRVMIHYLDGDTLKSSARFKSKNSFFNLVKTLESVEVVKNKIAPKIMKSDFRSGVTIYLSDFYDEDALKSIKYLSYKAQRLVLLQTMSDEELNPVESGEVRLIDSEDGSFKDIKLNGRIIESYKEKLGEFVESFKVSANSISGYHILVPTDLSVDEILFKKMVKLGLLR
jgi:uncharacterized protein (DUF58 family)